MRLWLISVPEGGVHVTSTRGVELTASLAAAPPAELPQATNAASTRAAAEAGTVSAPGDGAASQPQPVATVTTQAVVAAILADDAVSLRRLLTETVRGQELVNNTEFPGVMAVVTRTTALHTACSLGALRCIRTLVELGADPWVSSVVLATALTTGNAAVDFCSSDAARDALVEAARVCIGREAADAILAQAQPKAQHAVASGAAAAEGAGDSGAADTNVAGEQAGSGAAGIAGDAGAQSSSAAPSAGAGAAGTAAAGAGAGAGVGAGAGASGADATGTAGDDSSGEDGDDDDDGGAGEIELEDAIATSVVKCIEEDDAPRLIALLSGRGRAFLNQRLIQSGAFHWQAPLHVACAKGALACAQALGAHGADPYLCSAGLWADGWNAWKWCGGDAEVEQALRAGVATRQRAQATEA